MPYAQTEAQRFLTHNGVEVFHIYSNDYVDEGPRTYWYALHPYGSDEDDHGENGVFDVRELPTWPSDATADDREAIRTAICEAIDRGLLTAEGYVLRESCEASPTLDKGFFDVVLDPTVDHVRFLSRTRVEVVCEDGSRGMLVHQCDKWQFVPERGKREIAEQSTKELAEHGIP